jgi:hypothetical protein
MAITVKHTKVSTIPDGSDSTLIRPSDWNQDHTLVGLGTMAEQNANNVAITGGTITGVSGLGDVAGPASATDNAIVRFDTTTGKLIQNSTVTMDDTGNIANATLTSPKINEILDSNGNEVLGLLSTASATDYVGIKNGIGVGVPLHISSEGSSANIGLHIQPKGTGLVTISDGTDFNKGIRFRSSSSATSAITLLDAVATAGRVVTLPDATTTLVGRDTTDTLTNKSISGSTNTLSNIGNSSLTNSAITINGTSTSLGNSISVGTVTSIVAGTGLSGGTITTSGTIAIDSTVTTNSGTQTLTNKRINPRAVAAGSTSGNLTPNGDTTDVFNAFGLTGAITLLTPSGTPVDGQRLMLRFEDNGTGRGITWTTSSGAFRAVGVTLPTTTVASKITYVGCVYNSTDIFWDVIAVATQA